MKKNLLVIGASSDIGMEMILDIASDYEHIFLQYRKMNDKLQQIAEKLTNDGQNVHLLKVDLLDKSQIYTMLDDIIQTNHIPNNIIHLSAQPTYNLHFHKDKIQNYQSAWQVSVESILIILNKLLPFMIKQKYGRIIFMLSSYTNNMPPKYQSCYVTTKYALWGLMKSLAVEYIEKGITVNGISPDMIETKFLQNIPELIIQNNAEQSPLKRNIFISEIIPVIKYMLSDCGGAMTGQNIVINGGK